MENRIKKSCTVKYIHQLNPLSETMEDIVWSSVIKDRDFLDDLQSKSIYKAAPNKNPARLVRINKLDRGIKGGISGELITFLPAKEIEALENEKSNIKVIKLEGVSYIVDNHICFLIVLDHIVFLSNKDSSARTLEKYFKNLIFDKKATQEYGSINLVPDVMTEDGTPLSDITSLSINVFNKKREQLSIIEDKYDFDSHRNNVASILHIIGGDPDGIKNVMRPGLIENTILKLGFSREVARADINQLMKLIPDEDLSFIGRDGKEHNGILKLSSKISVWLKEDDSGALSFDQFSVEDELVKILGEWTYGEKIKIPLERFSV